MAMAVNRPTTLTDSGQRRNRQKGYAWAVTSALTSTLVSILLKQHGAHVNTWVATWLRISPYLLVLAVVPRRWFNTDPQKRSWTWGYLVPLAGGIVCYAMGNYLYQRAIDVGLLTVVVPVNQVVTVGMVAALGWWLLRDRLNRWFGVGAAFMLVGMVGANWVSAVAPLKSSPLLPWPLVSTLAIVAGVAFAVGSLSLRWAGAHGLDTYRVMWANGLGATVVLTLVVAGITGRQGVGSLHVGGDWVWLAVAGLVNGVTNIAVTQALRYAPVGGVTAIQAGAVPLTSLVAEVGLGEGGGLMALGASLFAIAGISIAARAPLEPPIVTDEGVAP